MFLNPFSFRRACKEKYSTLWEHSCDRDRSRVMQHGNTLLRKIEAWAKYQQLYLPQVTRLREIFLSNLDHDVELKAHEIPLWLPSQIRSQITVPEEFRRLEFELRIPQASEALDEVRSQLQVRAHIFKFKDRFSRGQNANKRARGVLDGIQKKIDFAVHEYRLAYEALCCLGSLLGETAWKKEYFALKNEDIRDLSEGKARQSEGRRDVSWIWKTSTAYLIDRQQEGHVFDGMSHSRACSV